MNGLACGTKETWKQMNNKASINRDLQSFNYSILYSQRKKRPTLQLFQAFSYISNSFSDVNKYKVNSLSYNRLYTDYRRKKLASS